jgi:alpha-beta hydrolase superfamily lysophospholipase
VYNYAKNELGFNQEEIILYGHSLGTGPSIDLAADENYAISALILQAPFLSILRTVADVY